MNPRLRAALRGYLYLAPNFLGFAVFTALPVVAVAVMTFFQGSFTTKLDPESGRLSVKAEPATATDAPKYLGNWVHLFHDLEPARREIEVQPDGTRTFRLVKPEGNLRRALRNTLVLLLAVPIQMAMSLVLAMLLNRKIAGRVIFRTLLFLPRSRQESRFPGLALALECGLRSDQRDLRRRARESRARARLGGTLRRLAGPSAHRRAHRLARLRAAREAGGLIAMGVWIAIGRTT